MYEYRATYVKTIDGDTVDALIDLGFKVQLGTSKSPVRLRLAVIDTPEKGELGWTEATNFTRKWFEANPEFIVKTDHDKSGGFDRWLADCYSLSGESISKLLLDTGLAKVYHR